MIVPLILLGRTVFLCESVEFAEAVVDTGLADAEESGELGHREVRVGFAGFCVVAPLSR